MSPGSPARFRVRHTLAEMGAARLWHLLTTEPFVPTLGALTGNQAVQQVKAGLKAIYLSGWQVAADANTAGEMYPDQSLYPGRTRCRTWCARINAALRRADQIAQHGRRATRTYWMAPIVADAEAGFGGALNAFELMKAMIEAGAAGVHFEDQLASEKKCGHLGGKVLVPIGQHIRTLNAARLAADVEGVPTVLLCRTDAQAAQLLTTDVDERDRPFLTGERTAGGLLPHRAGHGRRLRDRPQPRLRALCRPAVVGDLRAQSRRGASASPRRSTRQFPGKMLAYNCSPSFNWKKKLSPETIADFQRRDRRDGLQVPVRHPGRLPQPEPLDVPARARLRASAAWRPIRSCSRRSSPPSRTATPRRATSAKWASAISMRSRWRSPAASPRPRRWRAPPRRRSSTTTPRPTPMATGPSAIRHTTKAWCTAIAGRRARPTGTESNVAARSARAPPSAGPEFSPWCLCPLSRRGTHPVKLDPWMGSIQGFFFGFSRTRPRRRAGVTSPFQALS